MDAPMQGSVVVDEEATEDPSAEGVAAAAESAVSLSAQAGLDVVGARRITLDFADNGDVTVSVVGADGTADSGLVTAADIAADHEADAARDSIPPPPMAA